MYPDPVNAANTQSFDPQQPFKVEPIGEMSYPGFGGKSFDQEFNENDYYDQKAAQEFHRQLSNSATPCGLKMVLCPVEVIKEFKKKVASDKFSTKGVLSGTKSKDGGHFEVQQLIIPPQLCEREQVQITEEGLIALAVEQSSNDLITLGQIRTSFEKPVYLSDTDQHRLLEY